MRVVLTARPHSSFVGRIYLWNQRGYIPDVFVQDFSERLTHKRNLHIKLNAFTFLNDCSNCIETVGVEL